MLRYDQTTERESFGLENFKRKPFDMMDNVKNRKIQLCNEGFSFLNGFSRVF